MSVHVQRRLCSAMCTQRSAVKQKPHQIHSLVQLTFNMYVCLVYNSKLSDFGKMPKQQGLTVMDHPLPPLSVLTRFLDGNRITELHSTVFRPLGRLKKLLVSNLHLTGWDQCVCSQKGLMNGFRSCVVYSTMCVSLWSVMPTCHLHGDCRVSFHLLGLVAY